ncbi:MAG: leucine-rich repeat domain-containing protein [Oscillospiraceae bacterium]|nr:leucine-rich repeat domain-containing protein [Oscillospiraceae bacterium]
MDNSERLYTAILQMDFAAADRMIAAGVTLDGDIREALVKGPGNLANFNKARYEQYYRFTGFAADASVDEFAAVTEKLFELVGEPLYNTFGEYRYSSSYRDKFYDPKFFETLLKCGSGKQMRKQAIMQEIINKNDTVLLALCAKYGWLKIPRIRDAMIDYANKQDRPECTAWLLDFKNRTANLADERERAEKRMLRELNANPNPNSLTELKKLWRFTKLKDGTLEITCYKSDRAEVAVPEKIGGSTVTSIGEAAFTGAWYLAKRITHEICEARRNNITKVTLPETVTRIGPHAFYDCRALKEINIPDGVKIIECQALSDTAIDALVLPESVEQLADYSFALGRFKEIKLPQCLFRIGKSAFQMCGKLESIEIPERVEVIFQGTFWRCANLKTVVLHEGLKEIKARAFWECPELETINLPASIKKIENFKRDGKIQHVFADSPKLTAIVKKGSYAEKYCAKNNIVFKYKEEA